MKVYAAYRSVPDYHAGPPPLKSLHLSLNGAIKALYPDSDRFQEMFRESELGGQKSWEGPGGFGLVREMVVYP